MPYSLAQDLDHILAHTPDVWEDLRGARLFITGGTGFFGWWIVHSLAHANDRLGLKLSAIVLTRHPAKFAAREPELCRRDDIQLLGGDVINFTFPTGPCSHIIHAATEASAALNESDPLRMSDTIVLGTRRVLEFARQAQVKRLLLTSSGAVYGRQPTDLAHVSEDYAGGPDINAVHSAYAESKRMAEWLCSAYFARFGLHSTIARCFAFMGPQLPLDTHFAAGNFLRAAVAGREIVITGDGTPRRSYLYAADLAIWLWTILLRGAPCRPYNVGSERDISIAELAQAIAAPAGVGVRICKTPEIGKAPERYVPSTRRAARELGLHTWIELEDAVGRSISFAKVQAPA